MHEQSETIQQPDGQWINVYGRNTSNAGKQLPGTPTYPNVDDAVKAAKERSRMADGPWAKYQAQDGPWAKYAQPDPSLMDTASQFAYGANEKIADVIAAPGNLATFVTEPLIKGIRSLTGGDYRGPENRGPGPGPVETFLRTSVPPQTRAQRILRRTGEEVGAALPLAAVPMASALAPAGRASANLGGQVIQRLLAGIRNAPGAAASGELTATLGAGVGAGAAREAFPDSPLAETAGQLAGGFAPTALAYTPTALATRGARALITHFSPTAQRDAATREVAKVIGPELGMEASGRLQTAEQLRKDIPGFDPSLAEATGSPALTATQRGIEGSAKGAELEKIVQRHKRNRSAIQDYAASKAPEGTPSAEFVLDEAGRPLAILDERIDAQIKAVGAKRNEAAENLPFSDRAAVGDRIRDKLFTARQEARGRMSALADELGINDADVSADFVKFKQDVSGTFEPKAFTDSKNRPDVLQEIADFGDTISFKDVKNLRERIGDDLFDSFRSSSQSREKIRTLTILKNKVDEFIDNVVDNAEPGLAENYKAFRKAYLEEFITPFERGAAFRTKATDGTGFFRTRDEKVASAFFTPGDVQAARQFRQIFHDTESMDDIRSVALDSLRDAAVRDGEIKPGLFDTWVRRHRTVLDEFPEIAKEVESVGSVNKALLERQASLQARQDTVGNSILAKATGSVEKGSKTADQVIAEALKDDRKMLRIANGLRGSEEGKKALARVVWDKVMEQPTAAAAEAFIRDNERAIRIAIGNRHFQDIEKIRAAMAMTETVPPPAGRGYEPNVLGAIEDKIGMGLPQLSSRIFAFKSGRVAPNYLVTDVLGRFVRGRGMAESEKILKQALYDPEFARELAQISGAKSLPPERAKRLNARLFNLGMSDEEQE